jgi:mRNA interferase RelE/StbE
VESYRVEIKVSAIRELEAIGQKGDRQRVARRIRALGAQPRPPGCQKLAGVEERYRIRQGRYRVVYAVDDAERLVTVFRIGDRKEVYR